MLYTLVIILTIVASVLLIGIVLIQKSKGGGLGSSFAGSNQILGVRRTNDVVEKATWYLAAAVAVLSILSVFVAPSLTHDSGIRSHVETPAVPATDLTPAAAEQAPADAEIPAPVQEAPAED